MVDIYGVTAVPVYEFRGKIERLTWDIGQKATHPNDDHNHHCIALGNAIMQFAELCVDFKAPDGFSSDGIAQIQKMWSKYKNKLGQYCNESDFNEAQKLAIEAVTIILSDLEKASDNFLEKPEEERRLIESHFAGKG